MILVVATNKTKFCQKFFTVIGFHWKSFIAQLRTFLGCLETFEKARQSVYESNW